MLYVHQKVLISSIFHLASIHFHFYVGIEAYLPRQPMEATQRNIVIIGDGASGKTTLLGRLITGEFLKNFHPAMFESATIDLKVDGNAINLALFDAGCRENYRSTRLLSYPGCHVFLICFSVDQPDSLYDIRDRWVPEVTALCPSVPYIIVGCRTDIRYHKFALSWPGTQPTTPEMGEAVARQVGAEMYLECSAKNNEGVSAIFEHATRASPFPQKKPQRTLLVVGDGGTGKTSLVRRFYEGEFHKAYGTRPSDRISTHLKVDGMLVELVLVDVDGNVGNHYRPRGTAKLEAHAILICFSIGQPESLRNVHDKWVPEILHFCPTIPYFVIGCKGDLKSRSLDPSLPQKQLTTQEDGEAVCRRAGAERFLECSAKTNEGVMEVFECAAKAALTVKEKPNTKPGIFGFLKGVWSN
ncbi:GTP-binding protein Rho1 [Serendipita sp. 396]|nr:GTP-binding protein Rho1 [Serendipita sp. 396]KAG8774748.1 GTP-binding protein Rho1 [Serendipita sp. 397]KAG8790217.1 GTP-binding protein Rho1 [Serendipita sp. 398]KAG8842413.1 GTP-binding protein Rho1 [Serendipita sp. 411]KAG8854381.1 GTP-binding protein Rho1 [Serendipita sp. 405]